jgi:hypothetical protein
MHLKPTQARHIVVSRVMTGATAIILAVSSGSRGSNFGPLKVYGNCTRPSSKMTAALAAMNTEDFTLGTSPATGLNADYVIFRIHPNWDCWREVAIALTTPESDVHLADCRQS